MRKVISSVLTLAMGLLPWACVAHEATAPQGSFSSPRLQSVASVPPSATFLAAPDLNATVLTSTVIEGTSIKLALVNPSPAGGAFTYAFDCGSGSGFGPFGSNNRAACPTVDNGVRTVRGRIRDAGGTVTEYSTIVTIVNQKPHVVLTTAQGSTSTLGSPRTVSGTFTDPGVLDAPWAWVIQWGDGSSSSGSSSTQGGAIPASHGYTRTGTFNITMTVTDKDGGTGKSNSVSVQVVSSGAVAYVALMSSSSVAVVPTATNHVLTSVGLPDGAFDVAITPDGRFLYVTTPGPGFQGGPDILSVISTISNTVVATIHLGQTPLYVRVSPDGAFAYTGNVSTTMSVISTATNTLVGTIDAGSNRGSCSGGGVALTPDGSTAYMANQCSATVSVISTAGMAEVGFVHVGNVPIGVAMSVDGTSVYVANEDGTVSVIRTSDNSVAQTITVGGSPHGVTVNPNGLFVYVANTTNGVAVISTATNQVVGSFSGVGPTPISVAITPDGAFAYVTSFNSNSVSVVSTATNSVVTTVDVGGTSAGVAVK